MLPKTFSSRKNITPKTFFQIWLFIFLRNLVSRAWGTISLLLEAPLQDFSTKSYQVWKTILPKKCYKHKLRNFLKQAWFLNCLQSRFFYYSSDLASLTQFENCFFRQSLLLTWRQLLFSIANEFLIENGPALPGLRLALLGSLFFTFFDAYIPYWFTGHWHSWVFWNR